MYGAGGAISVILMPDPASTVGTRVGSPQKALNTSSAIGAS